MEEQLAEQQPKKRSKWRVFWTVVLVLFVVLGGAVGAGAYYTHLQLQPMAAGKPVEIVIPSGTGSAGIARILEEQGIIKSRLAYVGYLKYKKQGGRFQAGRYAMAPGMTLGEITNKLNKGDVVQEEMIRFTIPEGYTLAQIAEKLDVEGLASKEEVFAFSAGGSDFGSNWVKAIPADGNIRQRLEGYLFPETYEMKKDSTPEQIVTRMLSEWDRKLAQLPQGWQAEMEKRNLTFHSMLTIASLIEREVAVEDERPLVAGVIYNRIKQKMPLQIDATVQYLFDKPKERLFEKDLQLESPYNTYLNASLPPGPIASPGLSSIRAALYPEDSKYLFYVTKKDGSGRHLFAENFEQHKKNIAESKAGAK